MSGVSNTQAGSESSTYPNKVQVVQGAGAGLSTAESDHDNTNQGGNGEDIRREDTRDTSGFSHGGQVVND